MTILRGTELTPEEAKRQEVFMEKVEAEQALVAKKLIDKSRLFKRAHKAFKTSKARHLRGSLKTTPTFGSSLKWSWKIEKEDAWDQAYQDMKKAFFKDEPAKTAAPAKTKPAFKVWSPKSGFYRFYFGDDQYVQVSTKWDHIPDDDYETGFIGFYKLVGVSQETFAAHKAAFEDASRVDNLRPSRY